MKWAGYFWKVFMALSADKEMQRYLEAFRASLPPLILHLVLNSGPGPRMHCQTMGWTPTEKQELLINWPSTFLYYRLKHVSLFGFFGFFSERSVLFHCISASEWGL